MALNLKLDLPSGYEMPVLGFGTWQVAEEEIIPALDIALQAGYRHIDCAAYYQNEKAVGKVLKEWIDSGKVTREELFIVTKLPPTGNDANKVEKWLTESLENLQLDYLDMYLIHNPVGFEEVEGELYALDENGDVRLDMSTDHLALWAELERHVEAGSTRSIGVSNFNESQITRILDSCKIPVSNLQIELHVYFQQNDLVAFCKEKGIAVTAYSPLGSRGTVRLLGKTEILPDLLLNSTVQEIAKKHNRTCAQILLRHILQKGVAVIPKSQNPERIYENFDVLDWELDSEDVIELDNLDKGPEARICDFAAFFKGFERHPECPY
ncbi:1,5-anhydro-D-fructose reductase-like [Leptopilina heterotoma]|uniref:1,5-anhydro-D-fructose reductase-like n=1 Tax=Leptopilina heterotoma TaxID=63436 RepID=UPI001CA9B1F9|nr:1,5-anhydro-D-fructose reductase-like [Leptopilina heterotoma]